MAAPYNYRVSNIDTVSAVTATLPSGYALGRERVDGGIKYKLVYNAGGEQITQGGVASPIPVAGGPNSVTVTTVSDGHNYLGAVMARNATATTGTYFWGAYEGRVGKILGGSTSLPTGQELMISVNGTCRSAPTLPTEMVGNIVVGINLGAVTTATVTTDTLSGDCYINFR